jgi:hypothetical protein
MMAGHLVLAVITSFIVATAGSLAFWGVMPASVLGATALNLLELFVGFLQAYIFTFLSALFIGMAVHPQASKIGPRSGCSARTTLPPMTTRCPTPTAVPTQGTTGRSPRSEQQRQG